MARIADQGVRLAILGATGQVGMVMRRLLEEELSLHSTSQTGAPQATTQGSAASRVSDHASQDALNETNHVPINNLAHTSLAHTNVAHTGRFAHTSLPISDIRFLASARSAGTVLPFAGQRIVVEDVESADLSNIDIAIFSAGGSTSAVWAPKFAQAGAYVIDNSSHWRMNPQVPLVVSEVNPEDLDVIPQRIVANPNCTTMACMPVLKPLDKHYGIERLIVSSYQAVSGAGRAGVEQLINETAMAMNHGADNLTFNSDIDFDKPTKVARTIAFNVVPFIGGPAPDSSGETDEEQKLRNESRRILHLPNMQAWCTCVRVPVFTSHGMSVSIDCAREVDANQAQAILEAAAGVELADIPTAHLAVGKNPSFVGRVRKVADKSLAFFVTNDNLRKGAALNALELAKLVIAKHLQ